MPMREPLTDFYIRAQLSSLSTVANSDSKALMKILLNEMLNEYNNDPAKVRVKILEQLRVNIRSLVDATPLSIPDASAEMLGKIKEVKIYNIVSQVLKIWDPIVEELMNEIFAEQQAQERQQQRYDAISPFKS